MDNNTEVLFEELPGQGGNLGIITLNRPQALNSLNLTMINAMHAQLQLWASAKHIKAVVVRAVPGRAFCAGGDLRFIYDRHQNRDIAAAHFFRDEYQLNRCIFHFPKPYIALLDGITMGGGVGISIHGSHRIVTDKLMFAMPETGIGFFPDVGGSYFLPRLPGQLGLYLGLTGVRIFSDDCVALGMAQQKVTSEVIPELINQLAQSVFDHDARASVTKIIEPFKVSIQPSALLEQQAAIDECFKWNSMEEVTKALSQSQHTICKEAAETLTKKSPTSLKITLKALQEGKRLDFDACMRQDYRLVCRFLQGHDFLEGIRALIIDKDQTPNWKPSTLETVSRDEVEKYFAPLAEELA